jgi:hypothetical protein
MTVSKALGSIAVGGAGNLDIWAGSQLGVNPIVQHGGGILNLRCSQNTRDLFTMTHIYTGLAAGTYTIGMVGITTEAANWNNNEWGYISVIVFN